MNAYLAGASVTVKIPLIDSGGLPIVASSASYRVLDQGGNMVVAPTTISPWDPSYTEATISIPALQNALATGDLRDIRIVELSLITTLGTLLLATQYIIESLDPLVAPDNSFQTLSAAELVAASVPGLAGWNSASRNDKIAAMIQARLNIAQFQFRYVFDAWQDRVEPQFGIGDLLLLTLQQFNTLPTEFLKALKRAQVIEASNIISAANDDVAAMREQGVVQKKVGESSFTFSTGQKLKQSVHPQTLECLSKYITYRVRIGRM